MYTKLDEQRQANFIKSYINTHPDCTMKNIIQDCVTNFYRLKSLERQGYIKLPKSTPYGERNGLFKKDETWQFWKK
jgi:hypothetical protein